MSWIVEASNGILLPQIGWRLDGRARAPRAFVSHAHFDHLAAHQLTLCSKGTALLMRARMPGKRAITALGFNEPHVLADGTRVTLHAAGHIWGSAQFRAENEHGALLYTGDFKLRRGLAAEACETPHADTLIMETTFGRPGYIFPPAGEVMNHLIGFCRGALEDGETPVIFAYSLGKSQEVLAGLAGAGLPVMLHAETWKMTQLYGSTGVAFPAFRLFDVNEVAGHVVICPPQLDGSAWLRRLTARRTATVTGWAMDAGAVFRNRSDAAFPLSDHAGFDDLLRFVELVNPTRVFTVHGFTKDFARELRARGLEAWALGEDNQLDLPIQVGTPGIPARAAKESAASSPPSDSGPETFAQFAATAEAVRTAGGRFAKARVLAGHLSALPEERPGTERSIFRAVRFHDSRAGRSTPVGRS